MGACQSPDYPRCDTPGGHLHSSPTSQDRWRALTERLPRASQNAIYADFAHQNPCDRVYGSAESRLVLRQNAESFLTCLLGGFLCLLCLLLFLSELRLVGGGGSLLTFTHGDPFASGVNATRRRPDSDNHLHYPAGRRRGKVVFRCPLCPRVVQCETARTESTSEG